MDTTFDPTNKLDLSLPTGTTRSSSKWRARTGIARSSIAIAFLTFDGGIKLVKIQPVADAFQQLGYPLELARGVGLLELTCLALYVLPRTAALGAVLLTGFLGAAISTHLRIGDPWLSHT